MRVKMGDALTHDVVDRHERAIAFERERQRGGHDLHAPEERTNECRIELGKCHNVLTRDDEHVTFEHRRAVQEGHHHAVVEHRTRRHLTVDDAAEQARCVSHERAFWSAGSLSTTTSAASATTFALRYPPLSLNTRLELR